MAALVGAAADCASTTSGTYDPPEDRIAEHETAYIAGVTADLDSEELAEGAGGHVVTRSNFELRTYMGGWAIEDDEGNRLPLGVGRQLDAGEELRVHIGRRGLR